MTVARIFSTIKHWVVPGLAPDKGALQAQRLYITCVEAARHPFFYQHAQLPDTVMSRLEMVMVHVALVLIRLRDTKKRYEAESQMLLEAFFQDMDRHFRDTGVSDLKVGKRVRKLADLLYGRLHAYEAGLEKGAAESVLTEAVLRNIFHALPAQPPTQEANALPGEQAALVAAYLREVHAALAAQEASAIVNADVHWPKREGAFQV